MDSQPSPVSAGSSDAHPAPPGFSTAEESTPITLDGVSSGTVRLATDGPPRLEGYEMLGLLGRGGHGEVWRARQLGTGRDVAVKVLHLGNRGDRALHRFALEIAVTARLDHPNIAKLYESRMYDGHHAYVMEYIDGQHLGQWLQDNQPDRATLLRLFVAVCRAVQHAHQRGIIHRDLKPGNIMITRDGTPKILDFGLAKILATSEANSIRDELTQQGMLIGTPLYMAPEQLRGDPRRLDTRTDVYALGVILYRLIVGRHPHSVSGNVAQIMAEVLHREPCLPRSVDATIERDLETIMLHALAREPESRFSGAGAMADDLQRFLDNEPIQARSQTLLYVVRCKLAKHRGKVMLGVVALVGLLALTIAAYVVILQQRDAAVRAEARAETRLQEARRFVHDLVRDMDDALLDGPTAARLVLLDKVRGHLDALYSSTDHRLDLLGDRADTLVRIAGVQLFLLSRSSGGNVVDALKSYKRAEAYYRRAEQMGPYAAASMRLARLYRGRGSARAGSNDPTGAAADYREALRRLDGAVDGGARDSEARLLWLDVSLRLAMLLQTDGQLAAAEQLYPGIFAMLDERDGTLARDEWVRLIIRARASHAWLLGATGRIDEALSSVERGLQTAEVLDTWQRSSDTWMRLAILHDYAAWLLEIQRRTRDSLASIEACARIIGGLWMGDRKNRQLQNWLAWSQHRASILHTALGDLPSAQVKALRAVRIYRTMDDTRELRTLRDTSAALANLTGILLRTGQLTWASEQAREALALLDTAEMSGDDSLTGTQRRTEVMRIAAELQMAQGAYVEAEEMIGRALLSADRLIRRAGAEILQSYALSATRFDLLLLRARLELRRGASDAAAATLTAADEIWHHLGDGDEPAQHLELRWLRAQLDYLSARREALDDPSAKRAALTRILRAIEELDPDDHGEPALELAGLRGRILLDLGERILSEGRPFRARAELDRAMAELDVLVRRAPDRWQLSLQLGRAWALRAQLEHIEGRPSAARSSYGQAAAQFDRILASDRSNVAAARARAALPVP